MTAAAEASRLPRRWRHWLWWLAPLGLVLVVWQAADVARQQALQSLQQDAENELRLSATGLTGYLSRHAYLPRLLASREAVRRFLAAPQSQDAMPLNLLLDRFRATTGVSDIYLLDRHADTLAASNWHRPNTFIGENYAFRSYYTDAIAGRPGRFYGLGVQSLERGYYFSAPVWLDNTSPDATPDGVMVVKVLLDAIEASWADQEAELLVADADNVIFMASRPELRMASLAPLSADERKALLATRRYADEPLDHSGLEVLEPMGERAHLVGFSTGPLSGEHFLGLERALPKLGWKILILKPLDSVVQAQWVSALLGGGLYGIVLLGGGFGWQRLRLRRERELFAERERRTLARVRDELERNVASRTRDLVATNRRLSGEVEERKRAEADLRRTRDELVQAAKLAVLGQLAAGINHELNQPLAAIRAYAENARAFLARERRESVDRNLTEIVELTGRMAEISAQLRQFSRKGDERRSAVSVTDCFEYALRLFQTRLQEAGVRVERRFPASPAWVNADPVRLEQVLVNLIGNALQAMTERDAQLLTLRIEADDAWMRLMVEDNGPGIPPEQLTRIFEPFFTSKSPGNGLGLGLSISSRIIDDLGGRLGAENLPAGGARFTIHLPKEHLPPAPPCPDHESLPHA